MAEDKELLHAIKDLSDNVKGMRGDLKDSLARKHGEGQVETPNPAVAAATQQYAQDVPASQREHPTKKRSQDIIKDVQEKNRTSTQTMQRAAYFARRALTGGLGAWAGEEIAKKVLSLGKNEAEVRMRNEKIVLGGNLGGVAGTIAANLAGKILTTGMSGRMAQVEPRLNVQARTGWSREQISGDMSAKINKYGWNPQQYLELSERLTASGSGGMGTMNTIGKASRGMGINAGTLADTVGTIRQAGVTGGKQDENFISIMSKAVSTGMDSTDMPKYIESMNNLLSKLTLAGGDVKATAGTMAGLFDKNGAMNTGERAAAMMGAMSGMYKGGFGNPIAMSAVSKAFSDKGVNLDIDTLSAMTDIVGSGTASTPESLRKEGYPISLKAAKAMEDAKIKSSSEVLDMIPGMMNRSYAQQSAIGTNANMNEVQKRALTAPQKNLTGPGWLQELTGKGKMIGAYETQKNTPEAKLAIAAGNLADSFQALAEVTNELYYATANAVMSPLNKGNWGDQGRRDSSKPSSFRETYNYWKDKLTGNSNNPNKRSGGIPVSDQMNLFPTETQKKIIDAAGGSVSNITSMLATKEGNQRLREDGKDAYGHGDSYIKFDTTKIDRNKIPPNWKVRDEGDHFDIAATNIVNPAPGANDAQLKALVSAAKETARSNKQMQADGTFGNLSGGLGIQ